MSDEIVYSGRPLTQKELENGLKYRGEEHGPNKNIYAFMLSTTILAELFDTGIPDEHMSYYQHSMSLAETEAVEIGLRQFKHKLQQLLEASSTVTANAVLELMGDFTFSYVDILQKSGLLGGTTNEDFKRHGEYITRFDAYLLWYVLYTFAGDANFYKAINEGFDLS